MQKLVDFIKKYGWKGLWILIILGIGIAALNSLSSCSTIRAGYERTRYIESVDSTYIHYKPISNNSMRLERMTRARVTRVRDISTHEHKN